MTPQLHKLYLKARKSGYMAKHALHAAKSVQRFNELESLGLVKLEQHAEDEAYDLDDDCSVTDGYTNQFGRRVSPAQARKDMIELLERTGNWWVGGYALIDGDWELMDSIGMCVGYLDVLDWCENWYVPDIMNETVRRLEASWSDDFDAAYA